jgi:pseudaminic acid synthase
MPDPLASNHSITAGLKIGSRLIDDQHPTYIVAEVSANHHQCLATARELIYAIKETGADAVKLQTYTADSMTIDSHQSDFLIGEGTAWAGQRLYQLYAQAATPWEWHAELFDLARQLGLDCFSTPFDRAAVDFLETLQPVAYKIASFELVDLPLIEYVASKRRPVILSTGMATLEEIADAVAIVQQQGAPMALLKCTSAYPAPLTAMNLRSIVTLQENFRVPVGLSDHSLHSEVAVAAVSLGARIIEKHITLSRQYVGPDSSFSLEPSEFRSMVLSIRMAETALGTPEFCATEAEQVCRMFRRSLYAVKDIVVGEPLTEENVRCVRPGHGLAPKFLKQILGRSVTRDIPRGTPIDWGCL